MKIQSALRSSVAIAAVAGLLLAIAISLMFILVQPADRSNKFWSSLIGLVGAAIVASGTTILARPTRLNQASMPYSMGIEFLLAGYLIGVGTLLLLGVTEIPFSWLLALHLSWLLLYLFAAFSMLAGASYVDTVDTQHKQQRTQLILIREQLAGLVDRINLTNNSAVDSLRVSLTTVHAASTFATTESLPGSEEIGAEISRQLEFIDVKLQVLLQGLKSSTEIRPGLPSTGEAVAELIAEVEAIDITLKRRQRLMKQLQS